MKRLALLLLISCLLQAPAMGGDRYTDLGNKIQCACGCNEMLLQCNHVGCQSSDTMIRQLRTAVTNYKNDEDVLNWFRRNYGTTVVVSPATHGFELLVWVVPPISLVLAFLMVFWIVSRWRLRTAQVAVAPLDPELESLRARARKETEI